LVLLTIRHELHGNRGLRVGRPLWRGPCVQLGRPAVLGGRGMLRPTQAATASEAANLLAENPGKHIAAKPKPNIFEREAKTR